MALECLRKVMCVGYRQPAGKLDAALIVEDLILAEQDEHLRLNWSNNAIGA